MHTQHHHHRPSRTPQRPPQLHPRDLQEAFLSLRDEFYSVTSHIRELIEENAQLSDELAELKQRKRRPEVDVGQFKRELADGLARAKSAARRVRAGKRNSVPDSLHDDDRAWMKKMMMVMMLSDLA